MRRTLGGMAVLVLGLMLAHGGRVGAADAPGGESIAKLESTAAALYASLTETQRTLAVRTFDDRARVEEKFPGGTRAGIQIKDLTEAQRDQAIALLTGFTSEYGRQKSMAVAAQGPGGKPDPAKTFDPGIGRYYLCFFGEPGAGKTYAWRIAEHHLTLVQVEMEGGKPTSFGPILLGANPPTLWDDEEDQLIAIYGAITADERAKAALPPKTSSGNMIGKDVGMPVSELSPAAQAKVREMVDGRLKFFSPDIRDRILAMLEDRGGLGAQRIAFWGEATKRCARGGKWDFKLGSGDFIIDYENSRGHIHLALKATTPQP